MKARLVAAQDQIVADGGMDADFVARVAAALSGS